MKISNKRLKLYRFLASGLITLVFILHAGNWINLPTLQRMENILYDLRLRTAAHEGIDPRIVIVNIDEESLAKEGRWPWRRDKMAYLMDMLFDYYGVKLLGFDVVFAEPDTSAGVELLEQLASGPLQKDAAFLSALETMRPQLSYDEIFANSLKNRHIVLGYIFSSLKEKTSEVGLLPAAISDADQSLGAGLFEQKSYVANLPALQKSALSGGFFNNPSVDDDGIYRRLPLLLHYNHQVYEALSLALYRALLDLPQVSYSNNEQYGNDVNDKRLEGIDIEGFHIPVNQNSVLLVPYRGPQGSFKYISATDVLNGVVNQAELKDKIVLVGTTAAGLFDSRATPLQNVYPGVEIHANILSALLDHTLKYRPTYIVAVEIIILVGVFLGVTLLFPYLSVVSVVSIFSVLVILGIVSNYYCWTVWNVDVFLAAPMLLLVMLFGLQVLFNYAFESRKKKQLSNMFGQYVPPELVKEMSHSEEEYSLMGESREMTVLFSDVRGFTTISENMEPQTLCELMNDILTPVTQVIYASKGTVDKYIGDAVMAFWGAPTHNSAHAHDAVKASLLIIQTLEELTEEYAHKGWPTIELGIGINTGEMNVGNMGSQFRIAYTVMGDAVNLGSRLEGLTKQYGVKIIVGESTQLAAPGFVYRELDKVRVKGKQTAIAIYEPLGIKGEVSAEQLASIELLNQGLYHYRLQQWQEAREILQPLVDSYPDDKLYSLYLERISYYEQIPPDVDWDGVFTHTSK